MKKLTFWKIATLSCLWALGGCGQGLIPDLAQQDEAENGVPQIASTPARQEVSPHGGPRIMPKMNPNKAPINTAASAKLKYYGGHVISNVKVVIIYWGPNVNTTIRTGIKAWYSAVVNSPHMDWLSEYDTNISAEGGVSGTNQHIGRGSVDREVTISPSTSSTSLTNETISAELAKQIDAGNLPAPDENTLYQFYFPPGVKINLGSAGSCSSFCAYHNTVPYKGKNTYYSVMPDFGPGSGCDVGCGSSTMFNNMSYASSHELIEAVTDAEVGLATTYGPPLAWYDEAQGEIGDICNQSSGTLPGTSYVVQSEWSNCENKCIVTRTAGVSCGSATGSVTTSLTAPANGATVMGSVTLTANANTTVSGATISKVEFFRNGALLGSAAAAPYSLIWDSKTVANGSYSLTTKATDSKGTTGVSSAVSVTVNNPAAGQVVVNITSPGAGSTVSNTTTLSATASTTFSGATISKVEFFRNGILVGTANAVPYSVPWDTKSVANGSYSLTAKATDSKGNSATSGGVSVTVNNMTGGCATINETEPNNSMDAPNTLTGTCVTVSGTNANVSDKDFLRIDLAPGKTLKVDLTPAADADFDLYVYNSARSLIASSENDVGKAESISVKNTGTATYTRYIEVRFYSGARTSGSTYAAKVQIQ